MIWLIVLSVKHFSFSTIEMGWSQSSCKNQEAGYPDITRYHLSLIHLVNQISQITRYHQRSLITYENLVNQKSQMLSQMCWEMWGFIETLEQTVDRNLEVRPDDASRRPDDLCGEKPLVAPGHGAKSQAGPPWQAGTHPCEGTAGKGVERWAILKLLIWFYMILYDFKSTYIPVDWCWCWLVDQ